MKVYSMEIADEPQRVRFGVFEADLAARELYKRGTPIRVQEKPFQVLSLLLEHPGQIITREELKRKLWADGTFVDFEKGLNTAVKKLRLALGDSTESPIFIETIPRRGYRFIAPIAHSPSDNGGFHDVDLSTDEHSSGGSFGSPTRSDRDLLPRLSEKKRLFGVSCIALGLVATGIFALIRFRPTKAHSDRPAMESVKLTEGGMAQIAAISRDGRYVTYAQGIESQSLRLRQVATNSDVEILPPEPGAILGLTFSADGEFIYFVRADKKDWAFRYLYRVPLLGGTVQKLISDVDSEVSFSPDGGQLAYERCVPSRNDVELKLAKTDGTGQRVLGVIHDAGFGQFGPGLSWSPDGKRIAVSVLLVGSPSHWVIDVASLENGNIRELFASANEIGRPLWMPDGSTLIVQRRDQPSHRGQLWAISFPSGQAKQLTKDLSDFDSILDGTRDLTTVVAIVRTAHSNVWLVSANNPSLSEQITSGEPALFDPIQMSNGKILAAAQDGLWTINSEGTGRSRFNTAIQDAFVPSPCGSFVVFLSAQNGTTALMRADVDGEHPIKLAEGSLVSPVCSPDGTYVYYANFDQPQNLWRVSSHGGVPVKIVRILGGSIIGRLTISPSGELLAYPHTVSTNEPNLGWRVAITPANGGATYRVFDVPSSIEGPRWSPDGRSLQYLVTQDGTSNIWEQPMAGGTAHQFTHFASGFIFDFSWSPDGTRLLLTRGDVSSDVVLLRGLR
jgi:Tol biopolymer transport system component/DNA-binding winged helix-turn-helix (wHTH) protein